LAHWRKNAAIALLSGCTVEEQGFPNSLVHDCPADLGAIIGF
jgi:hypothetical protein